MRTLELKETVRLVAGNRCPDYDEDCKLVKDKAACFCGGISLAGDGNLYETEPAEGYCPFLIGMEKP